MTKQFNGKIALDVRDSEPDWDPYLAPQAPEGAPNVLFLAWDDLGYATMDTFGGPVKCPNMARIADRGVKFANFHTTALCSPTRASLLTGRNATSNGMATIAEFASGFPGISTRIPFENGFISEVLAQQGYNTYCVGKWHLTPGEECNVAAYKGRWPLGRGFERFYGWLGGETNSYFPDLVHDNHPIEPPGRPEDGYHLPPREVWEEKISPRTRAAIVCNPGNPTGTVYRPDELEMVLGIAKDHGLFVVADEVYREFCFDGERHRSFMNYRDTEDRVILIDSISKRFSACGARIGAVSTTNREAYEACHHFSQARLSPPTLGQLMAVDAFAFDDDYYAELAGAYVKRRDAVMEELSKMPGVLCEVPKGAFYAMAKLPVDDSDTFAAWMLSDFSHEGETTFVAPGGGFYATPGAGKQEVRIAYVFEADVMRRAMEVLGKGLEAYPGRIG